MATQVKWCLVATQAMRIVFGTFDTLEDAEAAQDQSGMERFAPEIYPFAYMEPDDEPDDDQPTRAMKVFDYAGSRESLEAIPVAKPPFMGR